jgi:glycogen operon protein
VDPSCYLDLTGCGNTLDVSTPEGLALALDCLRHWAAIYGVDGFRLDLAPALARDASGVFDLQAPLLGAIREDAGLADLKWIAEPWDLGTGGYRLGHFPAPWRQWNDRYRDTVRRFWRGEAASTKELVARQLGSPDLLGANDDAPRTVDFVTCHDGFTLVDLTAYTRKHNEANREANRDGHHDDLSANHGVEGPTADAAIRRARRQTRLGMLASLAWSRGVPMVSHGDEIGRSQGGNNNAYCHDGPLTWVDWVAVPEDEDLRAALASLLALRREHGGASNEVPVDRLGADPPSNALAALSLESGALALLNGSTDALHIDCLRGRAVLFDSAERLPSGTPFDGLLRPRTALLLAPGAKVLPSEGAGRQGPRV